MKRTQFFSAQSIDALQLSVNTWLSQNKNVTIIRSGMEVTAKAKGTIYAFYILYEAPPAEQSVAVAESLQQAIPEDISLGNDPGLQLQ